MRRARARPFGSPCSPKCLASPTQTSLADLYDELTMPPSLRHAHHALDRLVLRAYGLRADATEPEMVALLMRRYRELTGAGK